MMILKAKSRLKYGVLATSTSILAPKCNNVYVKRRVIMWGCVIPEMFTDVTLE
jgi:hypothetical protein